MTAQTAGYIQAHALPVGTEIHFYGNRRVIDVHNMRFGYVRIVTNRGDFEVQRNTWIAPAMERTQ